MEYSLDTGSAYGVRSDELSTVNVERLLKVIRRQWHVVLLAMIAAGSVGFGYALTAAPVYTATASIIIDNANQKIADRLSATPGAVEDEAAIMSQLELLKSNRIALEVGARLDLQHDTLFMTQRFGFLRSLAFLADPNVRMPGWLIESVAPSPAGDRVEDTMLRTLQEGLRVIRVPGTNVLVLDYSSSSADLSAGIAQAYADAYIADQLASKYDANRSAADWLQKRLGDLRQKSLATDLAVQKFKGARGLISSDGRLVSDQQLTQINSQLISARSMTADAEAKYNRIRKIVAAADLSDAVTESLSSSVINDLRSKYLEASRRQADIAARFGASHVQALRLKIEMGEYRRLMFEELGRIARTCENDYKISLAHQNSLEAQLARATGISASANDSQVQLRELEREAETYRNLYQTYLQRYQEAIQQQSFPVTEARVISKARVPVEPSAPRRPLIWALSLFIGLLAGGGLAAFREYRDSFFRTSDQIRDILNLKPVGAVPCSPATRRAKFRMAQNTSRHPRRISKQDPLADHVLEHPLSAFAETLRSARIAADMFAGHKRPRKIGVVSILPGEGKSTISINLAELLANQGARVLLVDADLRKPGATQLLGRHAERGIIEVLQDGLPIRDALMIDGETRLAFLPAVSKRRIAHSAELLASEAMDAMIRDVSVAFDYVIFDLPPLAPLVDARAIASKLDAYLLVIEWGKTGRNVVSKTLLDNASVSQKCAGVILNKVDEKRMKLYRTYGSPEFYAAKYTDYYAE